MKKQAVSNAPHFSQSELKLKGFKIYEIDASFKAVPFSSRRDFYKISINTGHAVIRYGDTVYEVKGTFLFFGNPHIPYAWEVFEPITKGYACVFSEEFLKVGERTDTLSRLPLFKIGAPAVYELNREQADFMDLLFRKIYAERDTAYLFKDDLIRNYIGLINHEVLKINPSSNIIRHHNAASRITHMFMDLLEKQFPIESKERPLILRTPQDYANCLSLHVNHLNRSVREVTGRPITAHLSDRIVSEAKALLQHTDWSIADVAYALGFEYPSYFNNYFKRVTGTIPKSIRANLLDIHN